MQSNNIDLKTIEDVKFIEFVSNKAKSGKLISLEEYKNIPFNIKRIFFIKSGSDEKRGCHAHRECSQLLLCIYGSCKIYFTDGTNKKTVWLKSANRGLLIPKTIWAEQVYIDSETILLVLCDAYYDESDYIKNYDKFLALRENQ